MHTQAANKRANKYRWRKSILSMVNLLQKLNFATAAAIEITISLFTNCFWDILTKRFGVYTIYCAVGWIIFQLSLKQSFLNVYFCTLDTITYKFFSEKLMHFLTHSRRNEKMLYEKWLSNYRPTVKCTVCSSTVRDKWLRPPTSPWRPRTFISRQTFSIHFNKIHGFLEYTSNIDAEAVYRGVLPPPKMSNRWNGFSDLLWIQDPEFICSQFSILKLLLPGTSNFSHPLIYVHSRHGILFPFYDCWFWGYDIGYDNLFGCSYYCTFMSPNFYLKTVSVFTTLQYSKSSSRNNQSRFSWKYVVIIFRALYYNTNG